MLTARELRLSGAGVTLIDRQQTGRESSWAGGGIVSPLYPWRYTASVTTLAQWSQENYQVLAETLASDTGIDPEWTQNGLLIVSQDEEKQAAEWAEHTGNRIEIIDSEQVHYGEPEMHRPPESAILMPNVAQVRNPRLVKALRQDIEQRGVDIREGTQVMEIQSRKGYVTSVVTNQGTLQADSIIVCAGAWSRELLSGFASAPDVKPVCGQMIIFKTPPNLINRITLEQDRYIIPRRDGYTLFGSSLEHTGFNKQITEEVKRELYTIATSRFPALEQFSIAHHWAGLRPGSPRGIPYIGQHPEVEGLYINAGHYRNGVVLGPASARLMADTVLGRTPIIVPEPYSLTAQRTK